ncbi:MAG: galactokinase [Hyphomonas sp.]|nr:galactokinase [Hyphomonas sp.]
MSLLDKFMTIYGRAPTASASVPGRVNLIGEHTDYNGGAVLPAAIERRVEVALSPNGSFTTSIQSTRFNGRIERPSGDQKRNDWTDYAMGALWKADKLGWLSGGVDLFIDSDVPDGAGVSSSAALITAILRAAAETAGVGADPVDVAKHARSVENEYIGMPCGIMDQMAVGLARPGSALALNTRDLSFEVIDIPSGWRFVVIHSGVRRELADGRYKARFEECQNAAEALGTDALCLLSSAQQEAVDTLTDTLRKRALHVTSEHLRTLQASSAMKASDLDTFARLMNESHRSYAEDFEASTPEIDALVTDALDSGARGARLTGGGFGGCIVVLLESHLEQDWTTAFLNRHPGTWQV